MKNDGQLFKGNETTDLHLLAYELDAIGATTMTTGYNVDNDNKEIEIIFFSDGNPCSFPVQLQLQPYRIVTHN